MGRAGKLYIFILSRFLPFLLVLGFARKSVDSSQKFLPTAPEILNSFQSIPDFTSMVDEDIKSMNQFWQKTQDTFFLIPDSTEYSEIWEGVNIENFFPKLGDTFNLIFKQISAFFRCFVPFFQMIGATFKMIGHALYIPIQFFVWLFSTLLGLGTV